MLEPYVVGVGAIVALSVGWIAVQRAWLQRFPETSEVDALAARGGCGACGCNRPCEKRAERNERVEEEKR